MISKEEEAGNIIKSIDDNWDKIKYIAHMLGIGKEGIRILSLYELEKGEHKHFSRCENCTLWKCNIIKDLEPNYPLFMEIWYSHGVSCQNLSPKPDSDGDI